MKFHQKHWKFEKASNHTTHLLIIWSKRFLAKTKVQMPKLFDYKKKKKMFMYSIASYM